MPQLAQGIRQHGTQVSKDMSGVGFERATQNRVIKLLTEKLGYRYGGGRSKSPDNSFVDEASPSRNT